MNEVLLKFKQYKLFSINKLHFLQNPRDFFNFVMNSIQSANKIIFVTMFIGTEGLGEQLLKALAQKKQKGGQIFLFIDEGSKSRRDFLLENLQYYDLKNNAFFVDPFPNKYIPGNIKTLFSVMHSKIYIFDDVIVLTGANLDNNYFSNRIDRYFVLKNMRLIHYIQKRVINPFINQEVFHYCKHSLISNAASYLFMFTEKEELEVLENILKFNYQSIYLSSAYLNLPESHIKLIERHNVNLISAFPSPCYTENLKDYFAGGYSLFEQKILSRLKNIKMYEFKKSDSSFHCKGLWCFNQNFVISIIGSTNFNERSNAKDLEVNYVIITKDEKLRSKFKGEIDNILQFCKIVTYDEVKDRSKGVLGYIASYLGNKYM